MRGERGKRLLRQRGEKVERSFGHCYETGGMRRVHLRHHPNILKRLLVHVAAFNLGLVLRKVLGHGTPGGPAGPSGCTIFNSFVPLARGRLCKPGWERVCRPSPPPALESLYAPSKTLGLTAKKKPVSTTGC
jgi:hypothetical protein